MHVLVALKGYIMLRNPVKETEEITVNIYDTEQ